MNRDKQIEEIRNDIFATFGGYAKWEEDWQSLAEAVYNAGYRKQSEWISVEERLPKENEIERSFFDHETLALLDVETQLCSDEVLVVVRVIEENYAFVATDCTKEGKWLNWQYGDYEVTHWMPLPEPPKMKGGE